MKYRQLTLTALYAALLCVVSPWVIPVGAVPITLASLGIFLISGLTDLRKSLFATAVYIVLGAIGLPVFSGFQGGAQALLGPTGGFIIGYLVIAGIICILKDKIGLVLTFCIATFVLYLIGTAWYMIITGAGFAASLTMCVLPFISVDVIKIIIACVSVKKLGRVLKGA